MKLKRVIILAAAAVIVVLAVSIILYGFMGHSRVARVFFFPLDRTLELTGEEHRVPRQGSLEGNVNTYMSDWLLGPLDVYHTDLFPPNTKLSALLLRDDHLYLDFTSDILFRGAEATLTVKEIERVIKRGVAFNFPGIEEISISVEGEPLVPDVVE